MKDIVKQIVESKIKKVDLISIIVNAVMTKHNFNANDSTYKVDSLISHFINRICYFINNEKTGQITMAEEVAKKVADDDKLYDDNLSDYARCLNAATEAAKQVESVYINRLSELQNKIEIAKYSNIQ
jgi:hypothetical protein